MNENKPSRKKMPRFNMSWIYGVIVIILLYLFIKGESPATSKEVTYTKFQEYVNKGYAGDITVNKDDGKLMMLIKREYVKEVFPQDSNKVTGQPFLTVEYGSISALTDFLEQAKEEQEEKKSYPPFGAWMSEKTIRILHNRTGVDTPEQLIEYDFKNGHIYGFLPNIELLQYAMVAGIKLKNYLY